MYAGLLLRGNSAGYLSAITESLLPTRKKKYMYAARLLLIGNSADYLSAITEIALANPQNKVYTRERSRQTREQAA
jgi:hypothetical protein